MSLASPLGPTHARAPSTSATYQYDAPVEPEPEVYERAPELGVYEYYAEPQPEQNLYARSPFRRTRVENVELIISV